MVTLSSDDEAGITATNVNNNHHNDANYGAVGVIIDFDAEADTTVVANRNTNNGSLYAARALSNYAPASSAADYSLLADFLLPPPPPPPPLPSKKCSLSTHFDARCVIVDDAVELVADDDAGVDRGGDNAASADNRRAVAAAAEASINGDEMPMGDVTPAAATTPPPTANDGLEEGELVEDVDYLLLSAANGVDVHASTAAEAAALAMTAEEAEFLLRDDDTGNGDAYCADGGAKKATTPTNNNLSANGDPKGGVAMMPARHDNDPPAGTVATANTTTSATGADSTSDVSSSAPRASFVGQTIRVFNVSWHGFSSPNTYK